MPLDFRVAPVVFDKGLDTHSARKLVVAGKWDELVNVSLSEDGSLRRRDGFSAHASGRNGNGLLVRNDTLLLLDGGDIYSVGQTSAVQQPGEVSPIDLTKSDVLFNETSVDQQDMSADGTGGNVCYVWRSRPTGGAPTGLRVTVENRLDGSRLVNNQSLIVSATATSPRVVFDGGAFFIFYIDGDDLFCRVIISGGTTIGSQVSMVNSADLSSANFDACSIHTSDLGQRVAVVYRLEAPNATSVQGFICNQTAGVPAVINTPVAILTAAQVTESSICGIAVRTFEITASPTVGTYVLHTTGGSIASGLVGVTTLSGLSAVVAGPTLLSTATPAVTGPCHVTATPVTQAAAEVMQIFYDQQSSYNTANIRPITAVSASRLNAVTVNQTLMRSATFGITGSAPDSVAGPQGPFIGGKAFTDGERTFLPLMVLENYFRPTAPLVPVAGSTDSTSAQCSWWLADTTNIVRSISGTWHLVGGALYGKLGLLDPTLGGGPPTVSTPCSTPLLEGATVGQTSRYGIALLERGDLQLSAGVNLTPVGLSAIVLTPRTDRPPVRAQLSESLYIEGAQLSNFDGQQAAQHGFPMFPEGIHADTSAAGSLVVTAGVHQVVAVYEWTDGAGSRHQSAPSLPVEATVAVNERIDVLVPTTQLPQNSGYDGNLSTLNVVCYMTTAGGLIFYRAPDGYTPTANDVTASTVGYTIGAIVMTDDRLEQNEVLYTQPIQAGTTLPNVTPGPLHGVGISQDRVWGFRSDEPGAYVFSQRPRQNTGLQFSPELGGRLPAEAGGGVLIRELDDKTILFAENRPYVVFGNGPDASGANNGFSEPQPIATDVGCSEPRSVVEVPTGLVFKSTKGWYLLGRDLSASPIGEGVSRYDANDVTSATLVGGPGVNAAREFSLQEVRFTSVNGPTLVYAYLRNEWSVFHLGFGEALNDLGDVVDAVWWPALQRYVHLHPPDSLSWPGIMLETPGAYIDGVGTASESIPSIYGRTAFLHVSALEGLQRVRRLFFTATAVTSAPSMDLTMSLDFNDIYDGPLSYDFTTDLLTLTTLNSQAVDIRTRLRLQKCKSVAFSFREEQTANTTLVPLTGIQAIALEVGTKKGVNKLPATQTIG